VVVAALGRLMGLCTPLSDEATALPGIHSCYVLYTRKAERIAQECLINAAARHVLIVHRQQAQPRLCFVFRSKSTAVAGAMGFCKLRPAITRAR
jgi:hypothetical protein